MGDILCSIGREGKDLIMNSDYKAGLCSLETIAQSSVQEIIAKTESVIKTENLDLKVPLMKEVRTHIAVARAFTDYVNTELS